jgi:hypothetical protein
VFVAEVVGVLIRTLVVAVLEHPNEVTVTVYTPALADVAEGILGFCKEEAKVFGPLHEYVVPPDEVKFIVPFKQTGLLLLITGTGNGLTKTLTVLVATQPAALAPLMV